jgi:hypothetical protein
MLRCGNVTIAKDRLVTIWRFKNCIQIISRIHNIVLRKTTLQLILDKIRIIGFILSLNIKIENSRKFESPGPFRIPHVGHVQIGKSVAKLCVKTGNVTICWRFLTILKFYDRVVLCNGSVCCVILLYPVPKQG